MSVPKNAFFYWSGGPLPWLREQALLSFLRLHPDWQVFLGSPERRPVPQGVELLLDDVTDRTLPAAARSDAWRYNVLHDHGGVFSDTDVLFLRNVEPLFAGFYDAWITQDLGTPVPSAGATRISIGVLAAQRYSHFFGRAADLAARTPAFRDYQTNGTKLLAPRWGVLISGVSLGAIPASAFYRGWRDEQVAELWSTDGEFQEHEFGLHWYGGSPSSDPFQSVASAGDLPRCWVRRALEHG